MNSAFRGGVDLSSLANRVVKDKLGGSEEKGKVTVPALSVDLVEAVVRSVIQISGVVPVIVSFYSPSDQESILLTEKLEKLVEKYAGKWFLAKLDVLQNPQIAEAFGITQSATVAMILSGEPRPLFQGDQSEEDLVVFLDKLLELAKEQGLAGQLVIGDTATEEEPQLSPQEQQALDAMDRGDFQAAVAIYEKELAANPSNEQLAERLAQVRLVARTYALSLEKELASEPKSQIEFLRKADCFMAIGDAESAFDLLLDYFAEAEDKKALTKHILDLFIVAGKNHPAAIRARKQLAAKMF
ncbi:MAG: tetratricopeptide repeat protein [Rhodoluna sp.]